eukprot:TRINITY_DN46989_c0_g1_i1.p1 TRINITY_DN46989_c0_g1~~TRINITY_DN46989_c0_g1_i1.p1  ORF type:complete len:193 (-),score=47.29 TRINITY_DN46989_c0_g1_i1:251-829(-)
MASGMEQVVEQQLLGAAKIIEEQIDHKISQLDKLDDDDLEVIREKRKAEMKKQMQQRAEYLAQGNGSYTDISEKDFFDLCKGPERIVVHFYRSTTWRCEIVDKHISELSKIHLETRFVKVDAEKAPFLVERLKVWMLPALVCIVKGKAVHTVYGFDEFGGNDDFTTADVEAVLAQHKVVTSHEAADRGDDED